MDHEWAVVHYLQDSLVITVSADGLATYDTRPSWGAGMTTEIQWLVQYKDAIFPMSYTSQPPYLYNLGPVSI